MSETKSNKELCERAEINSLEGDYQKAINNLNKVIESNPENAHYYFLRGNYKNDAWDHKGAINDYIKAIEIDPEYANAYRKCGYIRSFHSDYENAIKDFSEAIDLGESRSIDYFRRAGAKNEIGNQHGAEVDKKIAESIKPNLQDIFREEIRYYYDSIERNSQNYLAYVSSARIKLEIQEYDSAIEDLDRAVLLNPHYANSYYLRGNAKLLLRKSIATKTKESIKDFTAAILIHPNHYSAYINRGIAKIKSGDFKGAIDDCNKAIEINPSKSLPYINMSTAKTKLKDFQNAINDLKRAIKLSPNNANAYFNMALIKKHDLKDFEGAHSDFLIATKLGNVSAPKLWGMDQPIENQVVLHTFYPNKIRYFLFSIIGFYLITSFAFNFKLASYLEHTMLQTLFALCSLQFLIRVFSCLYPSLVWTKITDKGVAFKSFGTGYSIRTIPWDCICDFTVKTKRFGLNPIRYLIYSIKTVQINYKEGYISPGWMPFKGLHYNFFGKHVLPHIANPEMAVELLNLKLIQFNQT